VILFRPSFGIGKVGNPENPFLFFLVFLKVWGFFIHESFMHNEKEISERLFLTESFEEFL